MRVGMTEPDWKYIASCLANVDAETQVDFFKAFLHECSSWGTRYQVEMQLASINENLSDSEKETLAMLSYKETNK